MMTNRSDQDLVVRILAAHTNVLLRQFRGVLSHVAHLDRQGWVPGPDDPAIAEHLESLRNYARSITSVEFDTYLLCVGLAVPGIQRGIHPPILVLSPNRGGFSARRQREAYGVIANLREALEVGQRFHPRPSADTRAALLELDQIAQRIGAANEPDWSQLFSPLSDDEVDALAHTAFDWLAAAQDNVRDLGLELLLRLACYRDQPLPVEICFQLLDQGIAYPPPIYRDTGELVAQRIVQTIEASSETTTLNHWLTALAWNRSLTAADAFFRWSRSPPAWQAHLHLPAVNYTLSAGWDLEPTGQPRELITRTCYQLVSRTIDGAPTVQVRVPLADHCSACGTQLVALINFREDHNDWKAANFPDSPVQILGCLNCACFGPYFVRYLSQGEFQTIGGDGQPQPADGDRPTVRAASMVLTPSAPFAEADRFGHTGHSVLGGVPYWLQDDDYPRCIECQRFMCFLAQHDNSSLGEEGLHYAFYCSACHISAITFQQT